MQWGKEKSFKRWLIAHPCNAREFKDQCKGFLCLDLSTPSHYMNWHKLNNATAEKKMLASETQLTAFRNLHPCADNFQSKQYWEKHQVQLILIVWTKSSQLLSAILLSSCPCCPWLTLSHVRSCCHTLQTGSASLPALMYIVYIHESWKRSRCCLLYLDVREWRRSSVSLCIRLRFSSPRSDLGAKGGKRFPKLISQACPAA